MKAYEYTTFVHSEMQFAKDWNWRLNMIKRVYDVCSYESLGFFPIYEKRLEEAYRWVSRLRSELLTIKGAYIKGTIYESIYNPELTHLGYINQDNLSEAIDAWAEARECLNNEWSWILDYEFYAKTWSHKSKANAIRYELVKQTRKNIEILQEVLQEEGELLDEQYSKKENVVTTKEESH